MHHRSVQRMSQPAQKVKLDLVAPAGSDPESSPSASAWYAIVPSSFMPVARPDDDGVFMEPSLSYKQANVLSTCFVKASNQCCRHLLL